jgi:hypothetical protein
MNSIEIEYSLSKGDYLEGYSFYGKKSVRRKINIACSIILIAASLVLILLSLEWSFDLFNFIIALFFAAAGISELTGIMNIGRIMASVHFNGNEKFRELQKIVFSNDGLDYETRGGRSKIEWSYYNKFLESKNTFILIYGKSLYSIIPKRAFNAVQLEDFKKLLAEKIK